MNSLGREKFVITRYNVITAYNIFDLVPCFN